MRDLFSASLERVDLAWLKRLTTSLLIIWGLWTNFHIGDVAFLKLATPLILLGFLFILGFYGVRQNVILETPAWGSLEPMKDMKKNSEPANLKTELKEELSDKLWLLMEEEKVFLAGNLTLPELAQKMAVSTNVNCAPYRLVFLTVSKYAMGAKKSLFRNAIERGYLDHLTSLLNTSIKGYYPKYLFTSTNF